MSKESKWGVFRTGAWYDWAYTDRYQVPSNISHRAGYAASATSTSISSLSRSSRLPNSNGTLTPKLVVTAGIKAADYNMALNQYQDNGKTVGCLGGKSGTDSATGSA